MLIYLIFVLACLVALTAHLYSFIGAWALLVGFALGSVVTISFVVGFLFDIDDSITFDIEESEGCSNPDCTCDGKCKICKCEVKNE